ncbi:MAG: 16S rRNA (cytidine(1402)-2'-O)-methyltransferase [Candidatus Marithrix sp.]
MNNGTLYSVATPIGNLQDLSPRAKSILAEVDLIAAEDTRHSRQLLTYFGISTPLQSLHEHNEKQQAQVLLRRLLNGDNIALISDAGTPLISDPGQYLLQLALTEKINIVPIPGASALISALSVAGFPADKFVFDGFLSAKTSTRQQRLEQLKIETRTLVFYEAPHRIIACVQDMLKIFGEQREVTLVKELTKMFETIYRDNLSGIINWLQDKPEHTKGEFVLVVQGFIPPDNKIITPEAERIFLLLRKELSLKQASKLTSEITGISKNSLYAAGLDKV